MDAVHMDQKDQADETPNRFYVRLENLAHTWGRLIYGSGGELSQNKSYWCLVWWQWDGKKATM
eukprot:12453108-Ditylum_brightwellii.AAC.1